MDLKGFQVVAECRMLLVSRLARVCCGLRSHASVLVFADPPPARPMKNILTAVWTSVLEKLGVANYTDLIPTGELQTFLASLCGPYEKVGTFASLVVGEQRYGSKLRECGFSDQQPVEPPGSQKYMRRCYQRGDRLPR